MKKTHRFISRCFSPIDRSVAAGCSTPSGRRH